jgi:hypothetical protein
MVRKKGSLMRGGGMRVKKGWREDLRGREAGDESADEGMGGWSNSWEC